MVSDADSSVEMQIGANSDGATSSASAEQLELSALVRAMPLGALRDKGLNTTQFVSSAAHTRRDAKAVDEPAPLLKSDALDQQPCQQSAKQSPLRATGLSTCAATRDALAKAGTESLVPSYPNAAVHAVAECDCAAPAKSPARSRLWERTFDPAVVAAAVPQMAADLPRGALPAPDVRWTRDDAGRPSVVDLQFDAQLLGQVLRRELQQKLFEQRVCIPQTFQFRSRLARFDTPFASANTPSRIDRFEVQDVKIVRAPNAGTRPVRLRTPNTAARIPYVVADIVNPPLVAPSLLAKVYARIYIVADSDLRELSGEVAAPTVSQGYGVELTFAISFDASTTMTPTGPRSRALLTFARTNIQFSLPESVIYLPLSALPNVPVATINPIVAQLPPIDGVPIDVSALTTSFGGSLVLWNAGIDLRDSTRRPSERGIPPKTLTLRLEYGPSLESDPSAPRSPGATFDASARRAYAAASRAMWSAFYRDGATDRVAPGDGWGAFLSQQFLGQTLAQQIENANPDAPVVPHVGSSRTEVVGYMEPGRPSLTALILDFDATVRRACPAFFDLDINARIRAITTFDLGVVVRRDSRGRNLPPEPALRCEVIVQFAPWAGDLVGCGLLGGALGFLPFLTGLFGWLIFGDHAATQDGNRYGTWTYSGLAAWIAGPLISMIGVLGFGYSYRLTPDQIATLRVQLGPQFTQRDRNQARFQLDIPLSPITSALQGLRVTRVAPEHDGLVLMGTVDARLQRPARLSRVRVAEAWQFAPFDGCRDDEVAPELIVEGRNDGDATMFFCGVSAAVAPDQRIGAVAGLMFLTYQDAFRDASISAPAYVAPGQDFAIRIRMTRRGLRALETLAAPPSPDPLAGLPQSVELLIATNGGTRIVSLPDPRNAVSTATWTAAQDNQTHDCERRANADRGRGGTGRIGGRLDEPLVNYIPGLAESPAGLALGDASVAASADLTAVSGAPQGMPAALLGSPAGNRGGLP